MKPKFSDFQILAPNPGGRKARHYNPLPNVLGRGEVYPRPHRTAIVSIFVLESLNSGERKIPYFAE
jgi:hypothetical protein